MQKGDVIPDGEILYRYVKPEALPPGQSEIPTSVFQDQELSCDWKKLMPNPLNSFHISEGKSCVIEITVCDEIRNPTNPKRTGQVVPEWKQQIIYDPLSAEEDTLHGCNPAHSLIKGKKKGAVVDAIKRNSRVFHSAK